MAACRPSREYDFVALLPDIMDCTICPGRAASAKPKVYVTRLIPEAGIEILRGEADVNVNESSLSLSGADLKSRASDYDGLVTLLTDRIDKDVMSAGLGSRSCRTSRLASTMLTSRPPAGLGIIVTNTPGVLTETTVDFAWALLMAIARRIPEGDSFLHAGKFTGWGIQMLLGGDVYGQTLGIVGMGRIGRGMAKRARGFDMRILYHDEYRLEPEQERELEIEYADLEMLLSQSDFVSLHTPLTPQTNHLVWSERLRNRQAQRIPHGHRGELASTSRTWRQGFARPEAGGCRSRCLREQTGSPPRSARAPERHIDASHSASGGSDCGRGRGWPPWRLRIAWRPHRDRSLQTQ